ncbi:unnamed protein product [Ambrosiozyma monospora]|uniref:Unnamed protein product n=1 Tax=Ambrosiozyma monospora TaxID=43982 RepID=A0A9W6YTE1_AMBMO|nr:unnamed protein product [Ambrosiozyma monospora]
MPSFEESDPAPINPSPAPELPSSQVHPETVSPTKHQKENDQDDDFLPENEDDDGDEKMISGDDNDEAEQESDTPAT